ncbi:MAG: hypothetical protein EOP51_00260 [Sphingobacteriales bacterium]|nr:MAG: hypothetical protein EOP51_00260 [Sphingobacteriales bacterium]
MKTLYVLFVSLICFSACNGQSNPLQFQAAPPNIIKTQGSNEYAVLNSILEAKNGELWFSTSAEGIYKYDGKTTTNFTTKNGLRSNATNSLLQDRAGDIWIGTSGGVVRYNGKSFMNISLKNDLAFSMINTTGDKKLHDDDVTSMAQDKSGKIWIGTRAGVYYYDGKAFTRFLQNDNIINKNGIKLLNVQSIVQDRQGNMWFSTWFDGLCRYDGKEITNFKPNGEVWFGGVYEDRDGNIWAGRRSKGVVKYDGKIFTNVLQHGAFDECGVTGIIQDKAGDMWFGTEAGEMTLRETIGGVWKYDGKQFTNYIPKGSKGNYCVFTLLQDHKGTVWAGTRNTGLYRYNGAEFVSLSE